MTTNEKLELLRLEILNYARFMNRKMVDKIIHEAIETIEKSEDLDESQKAEAKSLVYYAMEGKQWKNGSYSGRGH